MWDEAVGTLSIKSVGTRWLKLVAGEMGLEHMNGSFSISLWAKRV